MAGIGECWRRSHHIGAEMMPAEGNDGEARGVVGEMDHSDSAHSHEDDGDVTTMSEVFADILTANEDLLHAAAECQLDHDAPSILAYQRILHRNLIEMADFVDAMFGVYNQPSADKDEFYTREADGQEKPTDEADVGDLAGGTDADAYDEVSGDTSQETIESGTETTSKASERQPERIRSLLIERFRLENRRRSQQRSARLWKKMRRKVRVEEGVSAVMFEAAERIAQLTVTGAALHASLPTTAASGSAEPSVATTATPTPDTASSTAPLTSSETQVSTPASVTAPATPIADASADSDAIASEPPTPSTPATSPPPPVAQPSPAPVTANAPSVQMLQFAPPPQQFSMSMLAASLPFASSGSGMLLPVGVDKLAKMPLPSMASGFNMLLPMAPAPVPTLFPPDHMSSVCADCVPLNRSAHECRSVRRHITPAPLQQAHAMMFNGAAMWPMAVGGPMAALVVPQPARPVPAMPPASQSTIQSSLKKVCEECKKNHKSVHYCRKTLGHTAPEWLSNTTPGEGVEGDPPKRKRRSKKQREADEAEKAAARAASMAEQPSPSESDAAVVVEANEI